MAYALDGIVRDVDGVPVSDALVYIFSPEGVLADLYDDLGDPIDNPRGTNQVGVWSAFSKVEGFHTVKVNYGGRERKAYEQLVGEDPITRAYDAAGAAEAFTGPTFASVSDGLANTSSGDFFAVVNGGIVTVYLNNAGSAIYQRDAVTQAALASTDTGKGAALVGFALDSTQAREQTLEQKARQIVVSPEDFQGYHGDGVTDDHAAFQSAADYLLARGGGVLRIPSRAHFLSQPMIYPGSALTILGDNQGCSRIVNGSTNSPALQFGDGTTLGYRNAIANVIIGGASGLTLAEGNCGLLAVKQSNLSISNVQTFQFPGKLRDGIILDCVTQSYLDRIGLQDAANRNLAIRNQCVDIVATNGRCDAGAYGVEFRDVQGMYFTNWTCYGNTINGWRMTSDSPALPSYNNRFFFMANCIGDTSGDHNWNISQLSVAIFTACWGSTQLSQMTNLLACGFYLNGADVESITFNACWAISNNGHGIDVDRARSVHLSSCMLGSDYAPEDYGGEGANNGKGGTGSGLKIGAGAALVSASGGHYEHNSSYGVDIAAGAQAVGLNGVELRYNGLAQVRNLANATGHQVKITNCGGYNPLGFVASPAVPASGASVTNLSGVDCMVYIVGGNIASISIGGQEVLQSSNTSVLLAAGDTITVNYSSPPSWSWRGN